MPEYDCASSETVSETVSETALVESVQHRPWPMPSGPWIMAQSWHDLLFAHWPVSSEELRAGIPASLEIDTYDGQAWLGIVPFRMSGVRFRGIPALPGLSAFPELNIRTYVTQGGKPGVFFFSLEAANPIAVRVARYWYHLPYRHARMACQAEGDGIAYTSQRTHWRASPAAFVGQYRPTGQVLELQRQSLAHWLTERYCLYAVDKRQRLYRGEIDHAAWPLQWAEAEIQTNTMAVAHDIRLPDITPLLHFSRRQDVVVWGLQRLS